MFFCETLNVTCEHLRFIPSQTSSLTVKFYMDTMTPVKNTFRPLFFLLSPTLLFCLIKASPSVKSSVVIDLLCEPTKVVNSISGSSCEIHIH